MQCPNCGTVNPEGARFCRGCGRSLLAAPGEPAVQPAPPASRPGAAAAAAPAPVPSSAGRGLGQILDGADLVPALVGTGLGALAAYLSSVYLPKYAQQYLALPFAMGIAVTAVAVLVASLAVTFMAYGAADRRETRQTKEQKQLIQKEQALFASIDAEVSPLLGQEG
jgi:hypothetical protein